MNHNHDIHNGSVQRAFRIWSPRKIQDKKLVFVTKTNKITNFGEPEGAK